MVKFCWDCADKWYRGYLGQDYAWDLSEVDRPLAPTKQCIECNELYLKNAMYWAHA